jgi:hypothetical protein
MPQVFAFEVEANLRSLIEEVLEPIVKLNKENNSRLGNVEMLTKQLDRENKAMMSKLDADQKLRGMVADTHAMAVGIQKELLEEIDVVKSQVAEHTQLLNVHEDKMVRLNDDRLIFEQSRDQLRNDIREFEMLVQEISQFNK